FSSGKNAHAIGRSLIGRGTLVDTAERERFGAVAARDLAVARQLRGARHDRRERHEIEPVVFEHWLQGPRIAPAQKLEESSRYLESPDVADAAHVEQPPLERRQPAAGVPGIARAGAGAPQPSRGV